jgi:pyruvate,water dikinase
MRFAPLEDAFIALLGEARRFPALREDTHFLLTLPLPIMRRAFLEMGRRLTNLGILQAPADVFHLRLSELEQLATAWPPPDHQANYLRHVVASRAAKRESLADVPVMAIPARTDSSLESQALVSGMAGSPGIAEGPVRLVRDVSAFGTVQPGDVLVAPYTNPSWTPLFRRVAAVVVDAGSSVSHAAIVAREYGIPAVMGTGNAMKVLQEGQRVIVDGMRGIVLPATEQNPPA